jgi:hypothetical protein
MTDTTKLQDDARSEATPHLLGDIGEWKISDFIREFERGNFTHVNDTDPMHRASYDMCMVLAKLLVSIQTTPSHLRTACSEITNQLERLSRFRRIYTSEGDAQWDELCEIWNALYGTMKRLESSETPQAQVFRTMMGGGKNKIHFGDALPPERELPIADSTGPSPILERLDNIRAYYDESITSPSNLQTEPTETPHTMLPNADGLKKEIPDASEAALKLYMSVSARTEGGLPGPGSIYEHGFYDGAIWSWTKARKLTAESRSIKPPKFEHYCPDWDELKIGPDDAEIEVCQCDFSPEALWNQIGNLAKISNAQSVEHNKLKERIAELEARLLHSFGPAADQILELMKERDELEADRDHFKANYHRVELFKDMIAKERDTLREQLRIAQSAFSDCPKCKAFEAGVETRDEVIRWRRKYENEISERLNVENEHDRAKSRIRELEADYLKVVDEREKAEYSLEEIWKPEAKLWKDEALRVGQDYELVKKERDKFRALVEVIVEAMDISPGDCLIRQRDNWHREAKDALAKIKETK